MPVSFGSSPAGRMYPLDHMLSTVRKAVRGKPGSGVGGGLTGSPIHQGGIRVGGGKVVRPPVAKRKRPSA